MKRDLHIYIIGALVGIGIGWIDVKIGDLLLTALLVMMSTMALGILRPDHPWRWIIIIAIFVPIVQIFAFYVLTQRPDRAQISESFLGFLTGIAGAYGGSFGRKLMNELFRK